MKLGILSSPISQWKSLEKTMSFYRAAMTPYFEIVDMSGKNFEITSDNLDCILNFNSLSGWEFNQHPALSVAYAMHGGLILDTDFLVSNFNKLEISDLLIVNCKSDVEILKNIFITPPQICLLPLPVNVTIFKPLKRVDCRNQLKLNGFDYVIGFVGRILPQKNLHVFLRMLRELKIALYPKKVCAIVNGKFWGDYPILPYVTEKYVENIVNMVKELDLTNEVFYFNSSFSEGDLAIFYNAMDILLHPTNSLDENFGYAPIEAMACGVPVIGAAYGGLKDSIISGRTGYLMPTWITDGGIRMDYLFGIEAITKLLLDNRLYEQMSNNCVTRVRNNYSFEICKQKLFESISQAIVLKKKFGTQRKPVKLKNNINTIPYNKSKYLPDIDRPWEYFQNIVSYYVSSSCPRVNLNSQVRLVMPIIVDDNLCTLSDDAWPAKYSINTDVLAFLVHNEKFISVREFSKVMPLEKIQMLVDIGLLVVKNADY